MNEKSHKFLEENTGLNPWDADFLDTTPKAGTTKEKISWASSKLKMTVPQRIPESKERGYRMEENICKS